MQYLFLKNNFILHSVVYALINFEINTNTNNELDKENIHFITHFDFIKSV
jgi:hypothetical protein